MPADKRTIDKKTDEAEAVKEEVGVKKVKNNQRLLNVLAIITALAIILAVGAGTFYFVIRNNIGGAADTYRSKIQAIPILKLALPKVEDPEDPKNMTPDEIKDKYNELRKKRDELLAQIKQLEAKNSELNGYKQKAEAADLEIESMKQQTEAKQKELEQQAAQLEEDTKKLQQMAAANDKTGFKEYYQKLDKATAQKIYNDIMLEDKQNADVQKIVQIYEGMESDAVAKIFEQMGDSGIDTTVKMLTMIKKDKTAEIIAAMSTEYAAKITVKLTDIIKSGT